MQKCSKTRETIPGTVFTVDSSSSSGEHARPQSFRPRLGWSGTNPLLSEGTGCSIGTPLFHVGHTVSNLPFESRRAARSRIFSLGGASLEIGPQSVPQRQVSREALFHVPDCPFLLGHALSMYPFRIHKVGEGKKAGAERGENRLPHGSRDSESPFFLPLLSRVLDPMQCIMGLCPNSSLSLFPSCPLPLHTPRQSTV